MLLHEQRIAFCVGNSTVDGFFNGSLFFLISTDIGHSGGRRTQRVGQGRSVEMGSEVDFKIPWSARDRLHVVLARRHGFQRDHSQEQVTTLVLLHRTITTVVIIFFFLFFLFVSPHNYLQ